MPRLTTIDYLTQRAALRREWFERGGYAFAVLSPGEQLEIHAFFEPAKNLSPLELLDHRKTVTARDPSLPQRAGRAFARIRPFLDMPLRPRSLASPAERTSAPTAGSRSVRVFSHVKPELDTHDFAMILIRMAKEDRLRSATERRSDDDTRAA